MKVFSTPITDYLNSGKPVSFWMFLRFAVKDSGGSVVNFDFTDKDADETVGVENPVDGTTQSRPFLGGGHIVDIEDITYVEGNEISTVQIRLSALSADVKNMVYGYLCARQRVEIHEGLINADTGLLVDRPYVTFFGVIDGIDPAREAADPDGDQPPQDVFIITAASNLRDLERGNQDLRSPQLVGERSSDEIGQYLREVGHWKLDWGRESKSHHDRFKGGRGSNGKGSDKPSIVFGRR